ncbi:cupin domain-containing protein [Verrucomicrobiota bacterium]
MRFRLADFAEVAKEVRSTAIYDVHDLKTLKHLVVSMTHLHPRKETSGHAHERAEEVYMFLEGTGEMILDEERFPVTGGDVVLIPAGTFHKVLNPDETQDLRFFCIFEKYEGR